ncbi:MAG: transglutaminaseTgpA domain-containing protein [Planctomycetota bacterium]
MNVYAVFRRLVFAQVLLGIVASCMAMRTPGLLIGAGTIAAISWYVTEGPRGKTIPRWLMNAGALVAVVWLVFELSSQRTDLVAAMGHFTMILQLLLLFVHKTDREYAQLLTLSVLQMVGASVLSVSMIYGVFLGLYCALALATVVFFHLNATAESVRRANAHAAAGPNPPARPANRITANARRQLAYFAVTVGAICGVLAGAVFVAMPRTGKSGIDFSRSPAAGPAQIGFSNTVRLGAGPIGTGSREPVLNLKIEAFGRPIGSESEPWLVRGAALDVYDPDNHTWSRSSFANASDRIIDIENVNRKHLDEGSGTNRINNYTAEVAMRDSRQRVIFSIVAMPTRYGSPSFYLKRFDSENLEELAFSPLDQQIRATASIVGATNYRLSWPSSVWGFNRPQDDTSMPHRGVPPSTDELFERELPDPNFLAELRRSLSDNSFGADNVNAPPLDITPVTRQNYARTWIVETPRIRELALEIINRAGLDRDPQTRHTEDDLRIVAALVEYFRDGFQYDLDNPRPRPGEDPLVNFLFETQRGHCELFAAGLTALCRSIGIPARVVTGFRASDFNTVGGYYVVRQSNAHAWTEVDGGPGVGWRSFDATPPEPVEEQHRAPEGILASVRQVYEHIEFAWIRNIVAFDGQIRQSVIDNFTASVGDTKRWAEGKFKGLIGSLAALPKRLHLDRVEVIATLIGIACLLTAALITIRLRILRRRRLARLQLTSLPPSQRSGLSRRLAFYLKMLDLLESRGYRRPDWQSPLDFARELAEANPIRFDPVVALTEHFYDIRFGHRSLDSERKSLIRVHLQQLEKNAAGADL